MKWSMSATQFVNLKINKSRNKSFGYIVDRIRDKLQSWKEKTLSYAGIVTLIKSITQAIPKSLVLIIAISITIGTLYLVFRPKLPKYSVDRLRIAQFNLSDNNNLFVTFDVTVTARNPNKKIGIYYGHRNITVLNLPLTGQTQDATGLVNTLQQQLQEKGNLPLNIKVNQNVRVKIVSQQYFQKKEEEKTILPQISKVLSTQDASSSGEYETSGSSGYGTGSAAGLTGIMVAKSTEFSYQELAKATNNFSLDNKIGQGGFGAVYYAELRGEKTAIKKMNVQASTEFLCELKVLTHVHHLNLVRLIGYCVEGSLFLVYEHIDNGNLGQYLHGLGKEPLPWSSRVQIALDSARGLEYIHEHTVPVYIHRDVKSANILVDKNLRGKVADFGLTKLIEVGNSTLHTPLGRRFEGDATEEAAGVGDCAVDARWRVMVRGRRRDEGWRRLTIDGGGW
ncbi:unnamed protein product [Vicia faba]|uniref:Protein kinase domain-containing protein n=1 Tax=Vicia faba TaxID=3906 RepID=A0AAV0YV14_VICFA|nr:unnamed protein product [Vicia faba]